MKKYLIFLTLTLLAACTKEAADDFRPADGHYTMAVTASKMGTKALALDGSTLNATWAKGDIVKVYKGNDEIGELTAQSSGMSTTLRGELTVAPSANDVLTLKFLSPSFSSQTGTLAYIAANCDYATATVTVKSIAGGNVIINESSANFINQQAIVKFTLIDKADGTTPLSATQLTVDDGTNTYTVTPASATNELYVAFPGIGGKTIRLNADIAGKLYTYSKNTVTFTNGQYYGITVKMSASGALYGKFSVSSTNQVSFSQGNLQYQASTNTWRFAANQYDAIGSSNSNVSPSYTGWIDSFGWGSGNQPTQTSVEPNVYSTFVDWGTNAISNGGNSADLWRTLSESDWTYLVFTRQNASSKRGRATINGMYCFVLLPDDWVLPSGLSFTPDANNWTNVYTAEQWAQMEAAGAVCFPASGSRAGGANNTNVNNFNEWGCYWSSTSANSTQGYNLWITSDHVGTTDKGNYQMGASVRLVYEAPLLGAGTEAVPFIISSEADWNLLAYKVNSGYTYSGKYFRLANDISVTTMVGNSECNSFRGTFDGDCHTLTINYNTTSDYTAPFRYIQGATFKNLKVTGSITTTMNLAAGIAGLNTNAVATFEQCATDVTINSSSTTEVGWGRVDYHGGLLARTNNENVNITDCVCGGSVNGSNSATSIAYGASFVGVAVGCTVTGTRCLSTTSYTNVTTWNPLCHAADADRSTSVFYYVNGNDSCAGATQVSLSDLNNSSYATALQAGRSTTVWVQYARTNQPMLKQFTKYTVTYNANGGSGSVLAAQAKQQGDDMTLSNSTLTLSGFTHTGWNTSPDGSGTHYDFGGTYSSDADVTLYAEWTSLTFNYTGAVQTFTVPATGYYTLHCYGAQGGYSSSGLGGKGGLSQLTYPLTKGDVLYIYVGGQGECIDGNSSHPTGGDGGWNGGGKGGTGVAWGGGNGDPYNGGGGGGGATHIATSTIGEITSSTSLYDNHTDLLLIAGGGGGGLSWGSNAGGVGGGDTGGKGRRNGEWNIDWNNGTLSCGKDGMTSSTGSGSAEGCGGGGAGYVGGNTWTVSYNANNQSYSGAGGSSWGETTNGKDYSTTEGGATAGGNGKAVITWFGTIYPTE